MLTDPYPLGRPDLSYTGPSSKGESKERVRDGIIDSDIKLSPLMATLIPDRCALNVPQIQSMTSTENNLTLFISPIKSLIGWNLASQMAIPALWHEEVLQGQGRRRGKRGTRSWVPRCHLSQARSGAGSWQ